MITFIKQILEITSKRDKKMLVIIFFMILLSSVLDLIGVSTILPIVTLLSAPNTSEAINDNFLLLAINNIFNIGNDTTKLAIVALLLIVIIYTVKTLFSFLMTYVNSKFTMSFNKRLRARLMQVYLAMPYEYHHENNSSTLIRKSTYDVDMFCSALNGLLSFLVKASTSLAIIIYLFIISWIITLISGGTLLLFAFLSIYILRKKNKKLGIKIQNLNSYNYKYLSQSFNGVKESKISNNEDYFISEYVKNIEKINHYTIRRIMYSSVPGHSLEFVGILGIVISLLIIISIGGVERYKIISTFAVFAYAVIKLLPCVTEITSYINSFAFYSSSVDTIHNDLREIDKLEVQLEKDNAYSKLLFKKTIMINNVSFFYKDDPTKKILNNISFSIHKNTTVAIYGDSGSGKTTLIDLILGLLKPVNGTILCDKTDINSNIRGWRDNLSYVPQNIFLTDDTIRNNVAFGIKPDYINDNDVWDALEKAELKAFVEESPKGLDTIIGERGIRLSGGQRQRIGIARAFYRNTNIIVLDEATSALDFGTEKTILNHIFKYSSDHTLIIITHRLNTIQSCDYIYEIAGGNLVCRKQIN